MSVLTEKEILETFDTSQEGDVAPRQKYTYSILNVCGELHAAFSGTADPLPKEEEEILLATLRDRLASWELSTKLRTARYETALMELIEAVVEEYEELEEDER